MNGGKYAAGGAGFVMMESTKVARSGCGTVGDTALWDDSFIPALARCASFIRKQGAVPGIQLGHSGRKARLTRPWEGGKPLQGNEPEIYDWEGWELVAPSAIPHTEASAVPRALSHNEARDMAMKWGDAAERARKCGFGSVEILASSSTTASQIQGSLSASWVDSTHATRKARLVISAYDTAAREAIRVEGSGTAPLIGFYGSAAVAKPTALTATVAAAPAGGTGTAAGAWDTAGNRDLAIATINNLKTRVDQLESKLQALGLLT